MNLRRQSLLAVPTLLLLTGCEAVVLSPSGDIAAQQRDLLVTSTLLMLIIIIPVMALTVFFAWKYRVSRDEDYDPDFHHSAGLELVIWTAPLAIVICLGAITWVGTHLLDPFRPLDRIGEGRPMPAGLEPLQVQAVALDWKWLFIYPQYGVASLNELAAPVDRPIQFYFTSTTVMNAFYVPAMAGMIYAMPGMQSQLHAVVNEAGVYQGFSAHYSGAGFSKMRFKMHADTPEAFDAWIAAARGSAASLDRTRFLDLARPSEAAPIEAFGTIDPDLFRRVVNRCVEPDRMCGDEMALLDGRGGTGLAGTLNILPAEGRRTAVLGRAPFYVATICTPEDSLRRFGPEGLRLLASIAPETAAPDAPPERGPSRPDAAPAAPAETL